MVRHMENSGDNSQHDFTKGKLCPTNLVAFYNKFEVLVDDVIYPQLCKEFNTVPRNVFV